MLIIIRTASSCGEGRVGSAGWLAGLGWRGLLGENQEPGTRERFLGRNAAQQLQAIGPPVAGLNLLTSLRSPGIR